MILHRHSHSIYYVENTFSEPIGRYYNINIEYFLLSLAWPDGHIKHEGMRPSGTFPTVPPGQFDYGYKLFQTRSTYMTTIMFTQYSLFK